MQVTEEMSGREIRQQDTGTQNGVINPQRAGSMSNRGKTVKKGTAVMSTNSNARRKAKREQLRSVQSETETGTLCCQEYVRAEQPQSQAGGTSTTAKMTITDIMANRHDMTKWMMDARQPFGGFLSQGVYDKYFAHLRAKGKTDEIETLLYDICWMSGISTFPPIFAGSQPLREWLDGVTKDVIELFPVIIGGKEVKLAKVHNATDFYAGFVARIIMTPEEAQNYDPTHHLPTTGE